MAKDAVTPGKIFSDLLEDDSPQAMAWVRGGPRAPYLSGLIKFYETPYGGVLMEAEVFGLPDIAGQDSSLPYGIQIREGGILPPLFSNQGYAWMSFYDKRFTIPELLNQTVTIRRTSGGSAACPSSEGSEGEAIGSGVIRLNRHSGSDPVSGKIRRSDSETAPDRTEHSGSDSVSGRIAYSGFQTSRTGHTSDHIRGNTGRTGRNSSP